MNHQKKKPIKKESCPQFSAKKYEEKKKQQFVSVDWIKRVTTVYQIKLTR
jgi:hypothetical protein